MSALSKPAIWWNWNPQTLTEAPRYGEWSGLSIPKPTGFSRPTFCCRTQVAVEPPPVRYARRDKAVTGTKQKGHPVFHRRDAPCLAIGIYYIFLTFLAAGPFCPFSTSKL